jgi:hypothetical protein
MADVKKTRLPRLTTPKGVAKWPWLNKADTLFSADGVYKITLIIPAAECVELCTALDAAADAAFEAAKAKAKSPVIAKQIKRADPYGPALDDAGEDTGNIEFRFKMNAKVTYKDGTVKAMKPFIFDAKGVQLAVCPAVYGGSICKVNFSPAPYFAPNNKQAGVSLRINAVQIINLVTGGVADAKSMGFSAEEGFDGAAFDNDAAPAATAGTDGEVDF